jgi:multisubunit Na+/H+ antiporter MnhC subunit
LLKSALLGKVSFWLVVIGVFALITPQPAWPEWLARMVLSAGVALGIITIGVSLWHRKRKSDEK